MVSHAKSGSARAARRTALLGIRAATLQFIVSGEQIEEDQPILVILKDRLLAITPGGEVVERPGKLQT